MRLLQLGFVCPLLSLVIADYSLVTRPDCGRHYDQLTVLLYFCAVEEREWTTVLDRAIKFTVKLLARRDQ